MGVEAACYFTDPLLRAISAKHIHYLESSSTERSGFTLARPARALEGPQISGGWGVKLTGSIIFLTRGSHRVIRLSEPLRGLSVATGSRVQRLRPLHWL